MHDYNDALILDGVASVLKGIALLRSHMLERWRELNGNALPEDFKHFHSEGHVAAYSFSPPFYELGEDMWEVIKRHFFDTFSPTKEEDFDTVAYNCAQECTGLFFGALQQRWLKRYFPNGAAQK